MVEEYTEDYENYDEDIAESVENDEMNASEAAFLQGYNEDEDNSFEDEKSEEE